jgi:hypothetical protein
MSAAPRGKARLARDHSAAPVIRVTDYDRIWSILVALLAVLAVAVWFLFLVWDSFHPHVPQLQQAIELIPDESGGIENGSPTDSLKLEGTGPERADATPGEALDDSRPEVLDVLQSVSLEAASADSASAVTAGSSDQLQLDTAPVASPKGGFALGTGTKPALGGGPGSKGGWPRHQRWYVYFPDEGSLSSYTRQLDYFGIELGALMPDRTITYLSELSQDKPTARSAATGEGEKRLFFTWQGGKRRDADMQLFAKAGVPIDNTTIIFHFYPPNTENMLATKEKNYGNRPIRQIRRTFFSVVPTGTGYDFEVTRQVYY